VRNGAVLVEVDVEPVLLKVLGHHHAGLDDARLFWQVSLAEGLVSPKSASIFSVGGIAVSTHRLVAVLLRQLLADELVGPLVRLVVARVAHESRYDERHFDGISWDVLVVCVLGLFRMRWLAVRECTVASLNMLRVTVT
jgi:hypothetical protein